MENFAFFNHKAIWVNEDFFSFSSRKAQRRFDDYTACSSTYSDNTVQVSSPGITQLKGNSNRIYQYYYKDFTSYWLVVREREETGKKILKSFLNI